MRKKGFRGQQLNPLVGNLYGDHKMQTLLQFRFCPEIGNDFILKPYLRKAGCCYSGHPVVLLSVLMVVCLFCVRLESGEWTSSLSTSIDMAPGHEHSLLIDSVDNNFSKVRIFPHRCQCCELTLV